MIRKSPKKYCEKISYKWRIWNWIIHSLPTTKHILWLSVTLTYSKERCCFQKETLSHTQRWRIKMESTQEGRDRCILIVYSWCCTAETNTTYKTDILQLTINCKKWNQHKTRRHRSKTKNSKVLTYSYQFSCSVMSNFLQPRGLQHTRSPGPSPIPRGWSNSCPSSHWCHPNHLILCHPLLLQSSSFPASGSFPTSQFFTSGGQSIGVSASA